MKIHVLNAYLASTAGIDIMNATHDVKRALRESGVLNGILTVFVPGATAGVVILENDPAIGEELKELLSSLIPPSSQARPQRRSGSGRSQAHLMAALLSSAVTIPIKDGKLLMGSWQEVVVYDFDDRIGRREIHIQVMGEGPPEKKQ